MRVFRSGCIDLQLTAFAWRDGQHLSHSFNNVNAILSNACGIFFLDRCFSIHFDNIEEEETGETYGNSYSFVWTKDYKLSWSFKKYG